MKNITDILKQERLRKEIDFQKASQDTKIPAHQLENLEKGNWQGFSSDAYLQGVLRKYAVYLGLDADKIAKYLKREIKQQQVKFIRVSNYQETSPRFSINWTIYILIILVVGFFGLQLFLSWQKPLLKLRQIPSIIVVNKPLLIKGQTEKGVLLYLNDEPIYQDEQGNFEETLYYKTVGERQIELKAIGVNGKEQTLVYTVKVKSQK